MPEEEGEEECKDAAALLELLLNCPKPEDEDEEAPPAAAKTVMELPRFAWF
jgi:hypothetical protein